MRIQSSLLIFWLALIASPTYSETVSPTRILVLGDSLSAAYNIPLEQGWVNLLRHQLKSTHPQLELINASLGGATTSNGLQRLPSLLKNHRTQLVIIELGANDGLQGKPIPYVTKNLDALIVKAKGYGAKILLVGNRLPPNLGTRYTQPFFGQFQVLAQKHDIPIVPFMLEGIAGHPEQMQADGLHPKAIAQPKVLENIWKVLKGMLPPPNGQYLDASIKPTK